MRTRFGEAVGHSGVRVCGFGGLLVGAVLAITAVVDGSMLESVCSAVIIIISVTLLIANFLNTKPNV